MKVVICGPVFNENVDNMLKYSSPAAGKFLNNLINGIENNGVKVDKAIYISYPLLKSELEILNEFDKNSVVEIKDKYVFKSIINFQKQLLNIVDEETVVIFYNMSYAYLGLKNKIEKKKGKSIFLLADHTSSKEYKNILRKLYTKICEYEIRKFEKIITLAENPNIKFKSNHEKISISGGIKNSDYKDFIIDSKKDTLNIMYSGYLSKVTGVDILLNAIKECNLDNINFYISGKGELEDEVYELSKTDKRLNFLGFLSHKQYMDYLQKADILINPRNMKMEQNNNNFPSKILDYLATGNIIISTKFSGHHKFDENIIFYDGKCENLIKSIEYVMNNYTKLKDYYYNANRELAKEYDWNIQAKKILEFIDINSARKL